MSEENKALVHRFYEELDRRKSVPEEVCALNIAVYLAGNPLMDLGAFKQFVGAMYSGLPDLKHVIEDTVAEGDKVTVRLTFQGTHQGNLMGVPPSGKQVAASAISIIQIAGGKVATQWIAPDMFGLMQQIGAIPAPGPGG